MRKLLEWTPVGSLFVLSDWLKALRHPIGQAGALIGLSAGGLYLALYGSPDPVVLLLTSALCGTVWWVFVLLGHADGYGRWMALGSVALTALMVTTAPKQKDVTLLGALYCGVAAGTLSGALLPLGLARLRERLTPLSHRQRVALAFAAPQAHLCEDSGTTLLAEQQPSEARSILAESWGVKDLESFQERLRWLLDEGHQRSLEQELETGSPSDFVETHRHELEKGIQAWDWGRAVQVTRWGVSAGYLDRKEAWVVLDSLVDKVTAHYSSWQEYGRQYVLGAAYWRNILGEAPAPEFEKAVAWAHKHRWKKIAWPR